MNCAIHQARDNAIALHEHPNGASSWRLPRVQEFMELGAKQVSFDQCCFGLKTPGDGVLMKKKNDKDHHQWHAYLETVLRSEVQRRSCTSSYYGVAIWNQLIRVCSPLSSIDVHSYC